MLVVCSVFWNIFKNTSREKEIYPPALLVKKLLPRLHIDNLKSSFLIDQSKRRNDAINLSYWLQQMRTPIFFYFS